MELYIVRHGQSSNNALDDPRNRVCDPPLTELGKQQAQVVAQHLATGLRLAPWKEKISGQRGYGITQLYCSPMQRALHTTQYIGQALDLAPQVWVDVHEYGGIFLDHGENGSVLGYPGKTRAEILTEFPNYVLPESITGKGWWRQQGMEDEVALHKRAARVAETLRRWAVSDEQIAIVSHGGFVDCLLKTLFSQLPGQDFFYYHLNTAISWITFREAGRLDIEYLNRVNHLPVELVS